MGEGAVIVPRWEWRTFGARFGAAEQLVATLTPTGTHDSPELYLISPEGETVTLHDGHLDITALREVDARGLHRWEPVLHAEFPLTPQAVATVVESLRTPMPELTHDSYSLDELVRILVVPGGAVRAVKVHKRQVRFTIEGCTGELSDVVADGVATRTLAVASEDKGAVLSAVHALGVAERVSISYPDALDRLLDGDPARYASIDVGTNSVKFHIGERTSEGGWRPIVDRSDVTQLGEGLAGSGVIGAAALERTTRALTGMVEEARSRRVRAIAAVGTAGMRIAANSAEVIASIEAATGVTIAVITGEEESRIAYLAVLAGLPAPDGTLCVFDTGGGSSQFTFGVGATVDERWSVDVGAVRFTERFGLAEAVSVETLHTALGAIAADLARLAGRPAPKALVGMGGAVTNLTAVMLALESYDADRIQGAVLTRGEVARQIEVYRSTDAHGRRSVAGLQPQRAEVILAGACVVATVMDLLGQESLTVSDRGLRHGLLVEKFGALDD